MNEELREWDKPLLKMFIKKLDEYDKETVINRLQEKGSIILCSGVSYDWVLYLAAEEDRKHINIKLWKGTETNFGFSDEMLESISIKITDITNILDAAKSMLIKLIEEKLPETPTHYLEKSEF